MTNVFIRELNREDKAAFISAIQGSQSLHHPWVIAPVSPSVF